VPNVKSFANKLVEKNVVIYVRLRIAKKSKIKSLILKQTE